MTMNSMPVDGPAADAVDEPLALSAPLAMQWAALHCARGDAGCSCEPYHGFWQYLRLMGLGATLGGHPGRYVEVMRRVAEDWEAQGGCGGRRILISGCADYSMLAHVLAAFEGCASRPSISVLDLCETPLALNRWYAQRADAMIETIREDILAHRAPERYDLVVTSSFLGYFDPEARTHVFRLYAQVLRPGGRLIFSNRLRPSDESEPVGFSPEQARRFADKVVEKSRQLPEGAELPAERAASLAVAYAGLRRPYPVRSIETVRALAQGAGLTWVEGKPVLMPPVEKGLSGPTLGDGSEYVFVIAQK